MIAADPPIRRSVDRENRVTGRRAPSGERQWTMSIQTPSPSNVDPAQTAALHVDLAAATINSPG